MKLEAKHLAPYLPYGLKVRYNNKEYLVHAIDVKGRLMLETEPMYVVFMNIKYVKPILRPLSSITKEEAIELLNIIITDDIIEKIHIDIVDDLVVIESPEMYGEYLVLIDADNIDATYKDYSSIPYSYPLSYKVYEWLFKNHFDVFGLIDEGLAIDKNINTK